MVVRAWCCRHQCCCHQACCHSSAGCLIDPCLAQVAGPLLAWVHMTFCQAAVAPRSGTQTAVVLATCLITVCFVFMLAGTGRQLKGIKDLGSQGSGWVQHMSRWGITASCWHGVTTWHVLTISLHDITSRSAVADRCRLLLMSGCLLSLSVLCKDLSPNLSRPLCSPQGVCVVVDMVLLISISLHVVVSLHSWWCCGLLRVIHHCGFACVQAPRMRPGTALC